MPKRKFAVDYGPAWDELVARLGDPFLDGPAMTGTPTFDRTLDVYRTWFAEEDFALPGLHSRELAEAAAGPALTETLPVAVPDVAPDAALATEETS